MSPKTFFYNLTDTTLEATVGAAMDRSPADLTRNRVRKTFIAFRGRSRAPGVLGIRRGSILPDK